jgi:hypothetical protein
MSLTPRNISFGYDEYLGIDPLHIQYIKDTYLVLQRISHTPMYLLQRATGGVPVGYAGAQITPLSDQFILSNNQYSLVLWAGGANHPDTRPYVNNGQGNIGVYVNGQRLTRVLTPDDIISDTDIAVVERKDVEPHRVEVVFNRGFSNIGAITYHYTTWEDGVEDLTVKRGDSTNQSLFGWKQYLNSYWNFVQKPNQILVRLPINLNDVVISDEGKVIIENRDSHMAWTPYVNDFDILILAAEDSPDGEEHRYEIVNSTDSIIQRQLVSQRFKLNLLEASDDRYNIPYVK